MKIFIPGGAGLVGINLIAAIKERYPNWELVVVDKKYKSIQVAEKIFPNVKFICEDLTKDINQNWPSEIKECDVCIMLQAEIGSKRSDLFELNNVVSTKVILKQLKIAGIKRIIHVSSSVVNSKSDDLYTFTKRKQEFLVKESFPKCVVLRPTLMFGWFDRKHLGWLANFMVKLPLFPIPGKGDFVRQPLFVGDFSSIIISCIIDESISGKYNISGLEKIKYLRLMKMLKEIKSSRILFIHLPIPIFAFLLKIWALISKNPAFTTSQLYSLIAGDEFQIIDWPNIFNVKSTPFKEALKITHNHKRYSKIDIPF